MVDGEKKHFKEQTPKIFIVRLWWGGMSIFNVLHQIDIYLMSNGQEFIKKKLWISNLTCIWNVGTF